ncbi:FAD-dependent monooxygenase [Fulvivirgaceae bacterium PWU4]|uniref:FAD-dependent monooxygenase n=1 Tax=Chryseosolibacter histidini TaxID=2782349 RepID=A0AAP2DK28_9BACT|nr:FAD-dependent monooxygenase [Chryseosolibacter histidini]MBT1696808.1 FAD-dependent monooxygenase [Chryseosolibacter histidini]
MKRTHAIIIGAGIAGPTMALFLKKAGITAAIYEAYGDLSDIGGPLNIAPNGMHILHALGLAQQVMDHGAVIDTNTFLNAKGKCIASFVNADARKFGFATVSIPRAELHRILVDAAQEQGIPIHYGKKLKNIRDREGQPVIAAFEDGTTAAGDLLIGADGINSFTRSLVLPESPSPEFTGVIGIGGFTDASAAEGSGLLAPNVMYMSFGPGEFFGFSRICPGNASAIGWWVNLPVDREVPKEEIRNVSLEKMKADLLIRFKGWHAPVENIIRNTNTLMMHNIQDLHNVRRWHKGRVILIGDAAHAMAPHAGQGASTSMEDAMLLAKLLRDPHGNYGQVFEDFQLARQDRVSSIIEQARKYGNSKKILSPVAVAFRDLFMRVFMRLFGPRLNARVYAYRIHWNE